MHRKIDAGTGLLGASGVLLLVSLFLPWFGGITAWTCFEVLDLVLAGLAVAAGAYALGRLGDDERVGLAIAIAALVIVISQLVNTPPAASGDDHLGVGAYLSLVAVLGMTGGAALNAATFSVSVDVRERGADDGADVEAAPEAPREPDEQDDEEAGPVVEEPDERPRRRRVAAVDRREQVADDDEAIDGSLPPPSTRAGGAPGRGDGRRAAAARLLPDAVDDDDQRTQPLPRVVAEDDGA